MSRLDAELLELGGDISEALEELTLPATLIDRTGIIRWQNRASVAFRGNHVGLSFADLVVPEEQPAARALITRILCHGEPAELALHVKNANGEYIPVQLSAVPVREGGAVVGIFGLGQISPPARPPAGRRPRTVLTQRQLEILRLLAEGRSTDEIAAGLSLSPTTVRNHIANLIAALGVHSRLQAVVVASRTGLLGA